MQEKPTNRDHIFKKNLLKTEQEFYVALLLLVWELIRVTSNQSFTTTYPDQLRIMFKKSEELVETALLQDATCS